MKGNIMIGNLFMRKTYGRIFIADYADLPVVIKAIKEVDPTEAEYAPSNLIGVYKHGLENELVYLHKFEMDKTLLTKACIEAGVWIWCVDGAREGETV